MTSARTDRLYLGWQYATPHPDPGPAPRRPTPPEHERLSVDWAAAQRREENLLNRPLKATLGIAAAAAAAAVILGVLGWLPILVAGLGVIICALIAGLCGYAVWQGERALRARMADERSRVGKLRAAQESQLFTWQAEHASRVRDWQALRIAYEHQKRWYGVAVPGGIQRVDVAGGTLSGWSAVLTTAAAPRLAAGGEVTVLDLTEGAVALDLVAFARTSGLRPLVWVLPEDLARLGLGTGLDAAGLADVLSTVASATEEQGTTRDLSFDNAILERVIDALGGTPAVAGVTAALRILAQVGDPRSDVAAGLISAAQVERLTTVFGRGAADRVVVERAWVLESQLRKLAAVGTESVPLPPSPLRVIAVGRRAGSAEGKILATYLAVALTHTLRGARPGRPWQHTVFVLGADRLRGDTLDRLSDACESTGTGLVLGYRSVPPHVKQRLGRGNAAVAFMRLGNAEDAKAASEQLGTEHRFVLSQLTETVGLSVTDTTTSSYTSTTGSVSSLAEAWSVTEGTSRGTGRSRAGQGVLPLSSGVSRNSQTGDSRSTSESETISTGINTSTAWGLSTAKATGDSESLARALQRSREFLVEQHELQQLPASAMIVTYAGPSGRQVVLTDANPGIGSLSAATPLTLEEFRTLPAAVVPPSRPVADPGSGPRTAPESGSASPPGRRRTPSDARPSDARASGAAGGAPASGAPASWRSGENRPPPNLGPPPARLDWRRRRRS
ncbi:MAG TPA: hypothetical protein VKU77_17200 [Streptosporangiaceae bacterium]|nr:hypothetical protein [Streptosporangiaceae bacterium]